MNRAQAVLALDSAAAEIAAVRAFLVADAAGQATSAATAPAAPPASSVGLQKPEAFYTALRASKILGPTLDSSEFQGCEAILQACAGAYPASWAAYALATAWLETAGAMQPVKEANWLSPAAAERYFTRMYDITGERPAKARELGNTSPGDGAKYAGRGYPQLTGKANYAKSTSKLRERGFDVDLVANPDLAMRPDIAAVIMVDGMKEGWFTGKSLRDYIPATPTVEHFKNARRVINGQDRAAEVAQVAMQFLPMLQAGEWR